MIFRRKPKADAPEVATARAARKHSEKRYAAAMVLIRELQEIREQNHFAEALRALIAEDK